MDYSHILLRYGEIFLKGKNKNLFVRKLVDNIKKIVGLSEVKKIQSRLLIDYLPEHLKLRNVFGLISYSPAVRVEKNLEEIKKGAVELLKNYKSQTFKVETKRSDKNFPIKSPDLNVEVGKYVEANSDLEFSFSEPKIKLGIEINQDGTYLFTEMVNCFGGLPTGVEGEVYVNIDNDRGLLAGLLFMKRGCSVRPISFNNDVDVSLLQKFNPSKIKLISIKTLAELENDVTLVSGQTFDNYQKIDVENLIFRPLISFSEEEIKELLEKFKQD